MTTLRIFPPSTIPRPWLGTAIIICDIVWAILAIYALFVYVIPWATGPIPLQPWSFDGQVTA